MTPPPFLCLLLCTLLLILHPSPTLSSTHAVIVSTSRYYFNYRHASNALSVYHTLKTLGVPDSSIILMLADDMPCNSRNPKTGEIFTERNHELNLYSDDTEVDYRGSEVSVESFYRVLTGRHKPGTIGSKKLNTDKESDLLVYMTGHGGNEFLKFQDDEEIAADDFRDIFKEMRAKGRYGRILFIVDTCQAATLASKLTEDETPEVFFIGSSMKDENSYAHHSDPYLGVAVIDRFTRAMLHYFHNFYTPVKTIQDMITNIDNPSRLRAHVAITSTFPPSSFSSGRDIPLADFFSSSLPVTMIKSSNLPPQSMLPSNSPPNSDSDKREEQPTSPILQSYLLDLASLRSREKEESLSSRRQEGVYHFHSPPQSMNADQQENIYNTYVWILLLAGAGACWFEYHYVSPGKIKG
mmetsp:Transcript_19580/g.40879  ORF Transcript_19580/g.40879 Transcript_19580/m.40879 type:complete len:410 (+) Transcript_19580:180-1409(+)